MVSGGEVIERCVTCLYPRGKPDLEFDDKGECSACRSFRKRRQIDWKSREEQLKLLLDKHHGECAVASSGGKDSHWIALKLIELGADVITITASTCLLSTVGRKNLDNLARYVKAQYEITPNRRLRARICRKSLQLVGDVSWPEHVAIFQQPVRLAAALGRHLVFYGENPQAQYGGPEGSQEAIRLTDRWRQEYGGYLGLRPVDLIGMEGLTERDLEPYMLTEDVSHVEVYFLGQFMWWDSHENARVAKAHGMIQERPNSQSYWAFENLDNVLTSLHDWMMYRKYGYGRAAAQMSVDIRLGLLDRDNALALLPHYEGFPWHSLGWSIDQMLDWLDLSWEDFVESINEHTNYDIHTKWASPFG